MHSTQAFPPFPDEVLSNIILALRQDSMSNTCALSQVNRSLRHRLTHITIRTAKDYQLLGFTETTYSQPKVVGIAKEIKSVCLTSYLPHERRTLTWGHPQIFVTASHLILTTQYIKDFLSHMKGRINYDYSSAVEEAGRLTVHLLGCTELTLYWEQPFYSPEDCKTVTDLVEYLRLFHVGLRDTATSASKITVHGPVPIPFKQRFSASFNPRSKPEHVGPQITIHTSFGNYVEQITCKKGQESWAMTLSDQQHLVPALSIDDVCSVACERIKQELIGFRQQLDITQEIQIYGRRMSYKPSCSYFIDVRSEKDVPCSSIAGDESDTTCPCCQIYESSHKEELEEDNEYLEMYMKHSLDLLLASILVRTTGEH
jgi:hypothetical protein